MLPTEAPACICDVCRQAPDKMTYVGVSGNKYHMHFCSEHCREKLMANLQNVLSTISGITEPPDFEQGDYQNYMINPREEIKNPKKREEIMGYKQKYDTLLNSGRIRGPILEKHHLYLMAIAHWFPF